jgi:hypothetical protein
MGTKSFVQIEINAVFTTTSSKMQFRSGVFDHFNRLDQNPLRLLPLVKSIILKEGPPLQLQRRLYQTAPICSLRQIMHIYPVGVSLGRYHCSEIITYGDSLGRYHCSKIIPMGTVYCLRNHHYKDILLAVNLSLWGQSTDCEIITMGTVY